MSCPLCSLSFSLFPPSTFYLSLTLTLLTHPDVRWTYMRLLSGSLYTLLRLSLLYVTYFKSVTSTHTNVHTRCHLRFFILYIYIYICIYIHAYTQLYVSLYIPADKSWSHRVKTKKWIYNDQKQKKSNRSAETKEKWKRQNVSYPCWASLAYWPSTLLSPNWHEF